MKKIFISKITNKFLKKCPKCGHMVVCKEGIVNICDKCKKEVK